MHRSDDVFLRSTPALVLGLVFDFAGVDWRRPNRQGLSKTCEAFDDTCGRSMARASAAQRLRFSRAATGDDRNQIFHGISLISVRRTHCIREPMDRIWGSKSSIRHTMS